MASVRRSMARQAHRDYKDQVRYWANGNTWRINKPVPPWKLRNGKPKKKPNQAA